MELLSSTLWLNYVLCACFGFFFFPLIELTGSGFVDLLPGEGGGVFNGNRRGMQVLFNRISYFKVLLAVKRLCLCIVSVFVFSFLFSLLNFFLDSFFLLLVLLLLAFDQRCNTFLKITAFIILFTPLELLRFIFLCLI